MSAHHGESTVRPEADQVLQDIADYVHNCKIESPLAFETARLCLIDTVGCGLEALRFPEEPLSVGGGERPRDRGLSSIYRGEECP